MFMWFGSQAFAGSATDVTGLYYTGLNSSNGLGAGGTQDAHWTVTGPGQEEITGFVVSAVQE